MRRVMSKVGEGNMARRGVSSCAAALFLLALLPIFVQTRPTLAMRLLQAAAVCMAFTSATVVNSLTAFASLQCDEGHVDEVTGKVVEEHPQLAKGKALGQFRSSGQLGRALGPLLGTSNGGVPSTAALIDIRSLCVVLDLRPLDHLRNLCSSNASLVQNHEVDSENKIHVMLGCSSCISNIMQIFIWIQ